MADASAAQPDAPPSHTEPRSLRPLIRAAASPALWIVSLFAGAGRLDWPRGWISVAVYVIGMGALGLIVHRFNPGLLQQRAKWRRKDTKRFDKVFLAILLPVSLLQPAVAGMDVVRFRSSSMPPAVLYPGVALFGLALALIAWTLVVNRHAETSVRIQTDRGHSVVDSGPYRFVRHPMYVGAIIMNVGTPLLWGSLWAMAVGGFLIALFVWRTALEDRTLRRELAGYEDYAGRTRHRLVPGLW